MRKNGFTLIELLAVIVILAIIALIATPIILGIINDARKESQERSVELYASAIRNGIAAYQLREMKEVAAGTYTSETLPFDVEYDGDVVCTTIELYEDGGVYVAGCEVNDVEVEYTYGTKQVAKGTIGICNPVSVDTEGTYTAGDKYECDVDPRKEGYDYTFYILNSTSTEVNLIMDSNIRLDGTAVKEENPTDKGLIAWYAEADDNSYGPITAMNHLQTATAGWTNVNIQIISTFDSYDDYGNYETTYSMAKNYTINARMPYYSEIESVDCWGGEDITVCPRWMVEYLDEAYDYDNQKNVVKGVKGYWMSTAFGSSKAGCVGCDDFANMFEYEVSANFGVRPVINLSI